MSQVHFQCKIRSRGIQYLYGVGFYTAVFVLNIFIMILYVYHILKMTLICVKVVVFSEKVY